MSKSRLKSALKNSISSIIYQVTSILCGFILPRIILSAYGSTYNGIIASITQFLGFFSVLLAGVQGASRVALYSPLAHGDVNAVSAIMKANERYYRKVSFLLILYIFFLSLVFPLILNENVNSIEITLLCIIIGASNFMQYCFGNAYKALLCADQSFYIINILQTITVISNTVICAILVSNGSSIMGAKLGSAIVYGINPLVLYWYVSRKYHLNRSVNPDNIALKKRWDVVANSLANIIHENVDIVFITVFCSASEVSVYSVYNLVYIGVIRLMQVFTEGMEASFGDMWAKKEQGVLRRNFLKYEYLIQSLDIAISGCMFSLILPFIRIYTKGVNDVEYVRPFYALILTLAFFTLCLRMPYLTVVQAAGKYKETKSGSFFEAGINIALTALLVDRIGIVGAIIGTVVANLIRSIQYARYVYRNILDFPFSEFWKKTFWVIFTVLFVSLTCGILESYFVISNWMDWLVMAVSSSILISGELVLTSICFRKQIFLDSFGSVIRVIIGK